MLDRQVVKQFLKEQIKYMGMKRPRKVSEEVLVETFCGYVEADYYEWLKDNFNSFFNHGNPDWNWIRQRIEQYQKN